MNEALLIISPLAKPKLCGFTGLFLMIKIRLILNLSEPACLISSRYSNISHTKRKICHPRVRKYCSKQAGSLKLRMSHSLAVENTSEASFVWDRGYCDEVGSYHNARIDLSWRKCMM